MTKNKVYIFKGDDHEKGLACCITVTNGTNEREFIGGPDFVVPRINELVGKGYSLVYDRRPDNKKSKLDDWTRSEIMRRVE